MDWRYFSSEITKIWRASRICQKNETEDISQKKEPLNLLQALNAGTQLWAQDVTRLMSSL